MTQAGVRRNGDSTASVERSFESSLEVMRKLTMNSHLLRRNSLLKQRKLTNHHLFSSANLRKPTT
jgi:hypothetical protein